MSTSPTRPGGSWTGFVLAAALVWHLLAVLTAWPLVGGKSNGRDFASYYYAARVALEGEDPYDRAALNRAARADGRRGAVHPFFYPPPFVAATAWVAAFDLHTSYRIWFWLDEAAALLAALVLAVWFRRLDPMAPAAIAVLLALMTAVPNNHTMGQANLAVLALLLVGLYAETRDAQEVGGAFVGLACMAKMSPALFVAWWLLRGRWRAAAAACVTALGVSGLSLAVVGLDHQVRFYTEILPKFASGDYNGLSIPIQLYGNHSLPNLLDAAFPGNGTLSGTARTLGSATTLTLVAGLGLAFRFRAGPPDAWTVAAQASAVGIAMLLIPVYTYEHHLVWALPGATLAVLATLSGRLGTAAAIVTGTSIAVLCFDLQALKGWHNHTEWGALAWAIKESKLAALLGLLGCCLMLSRKRRP